MTEPKKIELANIPTPLQRLSFEGKNFLIKRDDYTGLELSGNKVRKLEYLLYQAKKEKADVIFTEGAEQSNHARATAIAAAKLGMKSKLFLWGKDSKQAEGNLFLNKVIGADLSFLNKKNYENVNQIMYDERENLLLKKKNAYVIPGGGSSTLGIWGYINFMRELSQQVNLSKIEGLVSASGSGGTAAGLLVGAALLNSNHNLNPSPTPGSSLKIYAVNVIHPPEKIRKKILNLAEGCLLDYKISAKINEKNLVILGGYSKEGYKEITDSKIKLIKKFAQSSGIILDPAYTGKSFNAYYEHFLSKGKGMKNIFIHTGGLFGAFARKDKYI